MHQHDERRLPIAFGGCENSRRNVFSVGPCFDTHFKLRRSHHVIAASHESVPRVSDDELRGFVRSALNTSLRRLSRGFYDYHSSFAIETLDVEFNDGRELSL